MASYIIEVGGRPNTRVLVGGHVVDVEVQDGDEWRETFAPNVIDRALRECVIVLAHRNETAVLSCRRRRGRCSCNEDPYSRPSILVCKRCDGTIYPE